MTKRNAGRNDARLSAAVERFAAGSSPPNAGRNDARLSAAVERFAAGSSPPEVAAEMGVSRVTAWRWSREPTVRGLVAAAREARRDALADDLAALAVDALGVLRAVLLDDTAPALARVRAACEVLDRVGMTAEAGRRAESRERKAAEPLGAFIDL